MSFSWTFPARQEKSSGWYATAGTCLTAFVVWGFLWGYPLMSVVALIFAGVYLFMDNNARGEVAVIIDERGVQMAGNLHEYAAITAFSIIYESNRPAVLRLRLSKQSLSQLDIPLVENVDVLGLRAFLVTQTQEAGPTEFNSMENILRRLKL